ncbi:hypothetical protein [Dyella silvatica]|uniref:hypothetical protein n=1 Tax=Dyella silvatica TaxID=2992128 RepID=UPI00225485D4|nr:hypothetical protein [Dyella silvatica]
MTRCLRWALLGALVCLGGAVTTAEGMDARASIHGHKPPSFTDYPAELTRGLPSSTVAEPVLESKTAKQYRSVIRQEFREKANFAGHYRVAIWGCGTDCRNFAIIDKQTGAVYTMPGIDEISGVMGNDDERVDFKLDSKLLLISGCFNDDCISDDTPANPKAGRYAYVWTGKELRLIHSSPIPAEPVDTDPGLH